MLLMSKHANPHKFPKKGGFVKGMYDQHKLQRTSISELNKRMLLRSEPMVVVDSSNLKGKYIVFPYSEALEKNAVAAAKAYIKGEVSWDEYRKMLLIKGLEQLQNERVLVRPSSVIGAENVEELKKKNKLMATELLLEAAKFYAGAGEWHLCPNCGHQMLPASIAKERAVKGEIKGEEETNGEHIQTSP
jgi:hypothetical protein